MFSAMSLIPETMSESFMLFVLTALENILRLSTKTQILTLKETLGLDLES